MDDEVVVRVRFWEGPEDCRVEYYAVPRDRLEDIRGITDPHGGHSPKALASVRECGRRIETSLIVDIVEY